MSNQCTIDFSKVTGDIRPLHGVCCAPYSSDGGAEQPVIRSRFTEAHIPYCRLHDCNGAYGGSYFVDIPNVFPDFDADENDPASYDFYYTDEYIGAIQASGAEAYYRLGITIEWGSKKYTTAVPKDTEKWARICEHIIRHYNEGWADGFSYGITYWEIWNEPDNPGNRFGSSMWAGTKEDFFHLYSVTARHLKACFPDIKIGGYGSCGFYARTRQNVSQAFKDFVSYFTDFLAMVKREGVSLDFFSWHLYSGSADEVIEHAKFVRETLDSYGFTDTESHLNEWNIHAEGRGFPSKHTLEGAAFNASVLIRAQNTPYLDKAMYYAFSTHTMYNGFMNQNDLSIDPPWYSFVAYGRLYALGDAVSLSSSGGIDVTAATDGKEHAVLISNFNCEDTLLTLSYTGLSEGQSVRVRRLAEGEDLAEVMTFTAAPGGELSFRVPVRTVLLLDIV